MSLRLEHPSVAKVAQALSLGIALLLCAPFGHAQNNVGDLLDAGAKPITTDEFKLEIVQRVIFGPTASGGSIEVMYAASGSIAGGGTPLLAPGVQFKNQPVSGEWRIDDNGRICTSLRITGNYGGGLTLPPRCQVWFKYRDDYFIADSDSDRLARVLRRTVKQ